MTNECIPREWFRISLFMTIIQRQKQNLGGSLTTIHVKWYVQ